jgi:hypothetical protein
MGDIPQLRSSEANMQGCVLPAGILQRSLFTAFALL